MANFCKSCGKRLPFLRKFTRNALCNACYETLERKLPAQLASIEESIKANHTITPEQQRILERYGRRTLFDFYYYVCYDLATSNGFEEQDLATMFCVQQIAELSDHQARETRDFALTEVREVENFAKAREEELDATNKVTTIADNKSCKFCGVRIPEDCHFCENCGAMLTRTHNGKMEEYVPPALDETPKTRRCPCGAQQSQQAKFCTNCGTAFATEVPDESGLSPRVQQAAPQPPDRTRPRYRPDGAVLDNLPETAPEDQQQSFCSACGIASVQQARFCHNCGHELDDAAASQLEKTFCSACGAAYVEGAKFCHSCGKTR